MLPEGYKMKFTFFSDFASANAFGTDAITATATRVFNEWKHDWNACAEFVYVLNMSCWHFYEEGNKVLSDIYSKLYYEYYDKCMDCLNDEDLGKYWRFLD